mgnify:CR=1 FL=1
MAVPTSGVLTMEGLAQEVLYGTYGSGTVTSPIHMYDLINGGNSAGSGNSYPAINTGCTPNPHTRTALTLATVYTSPSGQPAFTLYYNSTIGAANQLEPGDYLFTNATLTTPAYSGSGVSYKQSAGSASTRICSTYQAVFTTDSTGKILGIACDEPQYL